MPESQIPRVESESPRHRNASAEQFQPDHLADVTLPRFGLVFFNHLIGEYDSFTCRAEFNRDAFNKISHLKEIYLGNVRPLTWGDLAALECLTLQLRTGPELRERFWALQTRYREAAPKEFVQDEMIITERAIIQTLPDDELRARAEVIACEFFRLCMLAMCREAMRSIASRRAWYAMLAFMVFYLFALLVLDKYGLQTLQSVLLAGAVGGFISAQRRIQGIKGQGESLVGLIELSTLSNRLVICGRPSRVRSLQS